MTAILDASAYLALLFDEPGAEVVVPLARGSQILSVNFSESLARVIAIDGQVDRAERAADRLEIGVTAFDRTLARMTAELREPTAHIGASFADRACLAFAMATGHPVFTADKDWSKLDLKIDIRQIR